MNGQDQIVITLVHGTWGSRAKWLRSTSALFSGLAEALPAPLVITTFKWSGKNSMAARANAAKSLAGQLQHQLIEYKDARHFLIGHSHGGNVAMRAVHLAQAWKSISLIFLSTPFLTISNRNLGGPHELYMLYAGAFTGIFLAVALSCAYLTIHLHGRVEIVATFVAVGLFGQFARLPLRNALLEWKRRADDQIRYLILHIPHEARFLILRVAGDEATLALHFMQFPGLLLTLVIRSYALVVSKLRIHSGIFSTEGTVEIQPRVFFRFLLVALFVSRLGTVAHIFVRPWPTIIDSILWTGTAVASIPLVLGLVWGLCFTGALLLSPLALAIMLVSVVPFGFDCFQSILFYDFSAEDAPPGVWTINTLPPVRSNSLLHTTIYENSRTIAAIVEWIIGPAMDSSR